jgi:hypothetical protein
MHLYYLLYSAQASYNSVSSSVIGLSTYVLVELTYVKPWVIRICRMCLHLLYSFTELSTTNETGERHSHSQNNSRTYLIVVWLTTRPLRLISFMLRLSSWRLEVGVHRIIAIVGVVSGLKPTPNSRVSEGLFPTLTLI